MSVKQNQELKMKIQAAYDDGYRKGFKKAYWAGILSVDILLVVSIALIVLTFFV